MRSVHEFDPNLHAPEVSIVAGTYAPARTPAWKTYVNVGHAKAAMHVQCPISRWELDGDGYWRCVEIVVGRG